MSAVRLYCMLGGLAAVFGGELTAQVDSARERIEAMEFEPLSFEQPEPDRHEVGEVPVLVLEDHDLPLVTVLAGFEGGYGFFPRSHYAAATGLPPLLRYGGVRNMSPESVDSEIERFAIQLSFGSGGGSISSSMNVLTEHFEEAMTLWGRMLTEPAFEREEVEIWRGRQLESVRRRPDNPSSLAFSEFNHLLYGDHPIGWEMTPVDLDPEALTRERLRDVHDRIVCRDNLLLGLTGDVSWPEARPVLERFVARVPECDEPLPDPPIPDVPARPGVYVMHKESDQAVIVMAHPTDLPLADDPEYFAATIGNAVLGGGGFSSRIMERVRTEEGYAYSASSLWTTPRRYPGLLGAVTRTGPETAVAATRTILETMRGLGTEPPTKEEVQTTIDRIVNGFVFNFDNASQIVSRTMSHISQDLPENWLERYLDGVQRVRPGDVAEVFDTHLRPDDMTILVVGDTTRIGRDRLEELGPVSVLEAP